MKILSLNPIVIRRFPKRKLLCEFAVEREPLTLRYIPTKSMSKYMCIGAIEKSKYVIDYIPLVFHTSELIDIALNRWGGQYEDWKWRGRI
jgi:hypothetical protein